MSSADFANILFAGPCDRFCPFCIGRQIAPAVQGNNLDDFPPRNLDGFIDAVSRLGIRQIVFTGTNTDPMLYRHQAALLDLLRRRIPASAEFSVHTNGATALRKMHTFNLYDRACISLPSFSPETYFRMMGSRHVPDLARIIERSTIPVKVSCVVNEHNFGELEQFLERCRGIGVRRVVLRKLYGETRAWSLPSGWLPLREYRGHPVYEMDGMEITWWDFSRGESTSINLFADGTLGTSYLLAKTPEIAA